MPISLNLSTSVALRRRHGSPQVSHMRFTSYLPDLRRLLPYRYGVNRTWPALPESSPLIRFLFVRLTLCYRLPSSVCYLPDSAESLVLPSIGRTVDFHHQSHVRCWAHKQNAARTTKSGLRLSPNRAPVLWAAVSTRILFFAALQTTDRKHIGAVLAGRSQI